MDADGGVGRPLEHVACSSERTYCGVSLVGMYGKDSEDWDDDQDAVVCLSCKKLHRRHRITRAVSACSGSRVRFTEPPECRLIAATLWATIWRVVAFSTGTAIAALGIVAAFRALE